jgi:hypothetical protein
MFEGWRISPELTVSKEDDLTYDFKCGHKFWKTIFTLKSHKKTVKSNLEHFLHYVGSKILAHPR